MMDFSSKPPKGLPATKPRLAQLAVPLAQELAKMSTSELQDVLEVNEQVADQSHKKFEMFDTNTPGTVRDNAKQAILAYTGGLFDGLQADALSTEDLAFAQNHVRILCALYGVLRPLDIIQPYRLEMKSETDSHGKMADFWRNRISNLLVQDLRQSKQESKTEGVIVDCLAEEDFEQAINFDDLPSGMRYIRLEFRDTAEGKQSMQAKKARGILVRYAIENRIDSIDGLKRFRGGGFHFDDQASDDSTLVFTSQSKRKSHDMNEEKQIGEDEAVEGAMRGRRYTNGRKGQRITSDDMEQVSTIGSRLHQAMSEAGRRSSTVGSDRGQDMEDKDDDETEQIGSTHDSRASRKGAEAQDSEE